MGVHSQVEIAPPSLAICPIALRSQLVRSPAIGQFSNRVTIGLVDSGSSDF
ncbi:MAG: hypothetical protein U7126_28300 [Microcoleus sp.]